jgi:hypothetical protein
MFENLLSGISNAGVGIGDINDGWFQNMLGANYAVDVFIAQSKSLKTISTGI